MNDATTDQNTGADGAAPEDTRTVKQLQDRARELDITGRSSLDRDGLIAAIADAETTSDAVGLPPGTPDEVGHPPLAEVAERQAADRIAHGRRMPGTDAPDTDGQEG